MSFNVARNNFEAIAFSVTDASIHFAFIQLLMWFENTTHHNVYKYIERSKLSITKRILTITLVYLDECNHCDVNAICVNGHCICEQGYVGDGLECWGKCLSSLVHYYLKTYMNSQKLEKFPNGCLGKV